LTSRHATKLPPSQTGSNTPTRTYLWIVDWDDRFIQPRIVNVYRLDVAHEQVADFEAFMRDEQLPEQGAASTRVGGPVRQVLLRERDPDDTPTGLNATDTDVSDRLRALCQQIAIDNFVEVASWPEPTA
jgi:hypothetical protein